MILTGPEIARLVHVTKQARESGYFQDTGMWIEIEPFYPAQVNPNSYNLRLGPEVLEYGRGTIFNTKQSAPTATRHTITSAGFTIFPGRGYLFATVERTRCGGLVPTIDGRSGTGRQFLMTHVTAGYGDDGFNGIWTLEMVALVGPVTVYPDDLLVQIRFEPTFGERRPYRGKYQGQTGPTPYRVKCQWCDGSGVALGAAPDRGNPPCGNPRCIKGYV